MLKIICWCETTTILSNWKFMCKKIWVVRYISIIKKKVLFPLRNPACEMVGQTESHLKLQVARWRQMQNTSWQMACLSTSKRKIHQIKILSAAIWHCYYGNSTYISKLVRSFKNHIGFSVSKIINIRISFYIQ